MTLERRYKFRGLNKRSSDINMDPEFASDLQNVELTPRRELVKRYGYDIAATIGFSPIDSMELVNTKEFVLATTSGLHRMNGSSFDQINLGGATPADGWSDYLDYDEYNDVLYYTDTSGKTDLFKYDGYSAYKAGIPKVTATTATGVGTKYYRLIYYFIDARGNVHWGDYLQFELLADFASFTVDTFNGTEHYSKGAISSGVQTINSGNLTLNVLAGHNYVLGDYIRGLSTLGDFKMLEVASVGATSITLTSASVGTDSFSYGASEQAERRLHLAVFQSNNKTFGYTKDIADTVLNSSIATQAVAWSGGGTTPLEDVYDPTEIKGLPPRCKYITIYGYTMVLGNQQELSSVSTDVTNYAKDQIFWSDTGVGSSVETYPPFNKEVIGNTSEGNVSGLFGSEDQLVILKEKQIYYINGILIGRGFRLRSALTAGIGCISHKSIIETESGCLFQSIKGIYFAGGGVAPSELSDIIETIFIQDTAGLDLTRCRATRDTINEKLLFFIPATNSADNVVLVWDYYYKEWFLHKGINADSGLLIHQDELYHCDGTNIFKRSTSYNDNNAAINAFWYSAWDDKGMPSIRKKFINMVVHSIGALKWACNIITQVDWIDSNNTDGTINFTSDISNDDHKLNMAQNKSMRFGIANKKINEGMLVTGYEYEWESTQKKPKGES